MKYKKEIWMPPCRVREHARAKRVIMKVAPGSGLVVTVPRGFDRKFLPAILNQHREWIERQLRKVSQALPEEPTQWLPQTILLRANGETWSVRYRDQAGRDLVMNWRLLPEQVIELRGDLSRTSDACWLLKQWLKDQGRRILLPWVQHWGDSLGVHASRIQFRVQKTRWGSYSSRGTLSLNASLLFLPRRLVDYVLVHELCHIDHPDHSASFWQHVGQWQPDHRVLDQEMKESAGLVPAWVRF